MYLSLSGGTCPDLHGVDGKNNTEHITVFVLGGIHPSRCVSWGARIGAHPLSTNKIPEC